MSASPKTVERKEKNLDVVRKWYHNHSDDYNETRRKKYANDPELREAARKRAKSYRERKRKGKSPDPTPLWRFVDASGPVEYGKGVRIPVWTTGQIADELEGTPQMLRNWEKRGWIPPSMFPDKHRLYTKKQSDLIKMFASFMETYRSSPKALADARDELVKQIHKEWKDLS